MQLDFHQPPDCVLESATIQVTLDEDDPSLKPYLEDVLPVSECPVLITDYYGPGQIVGAPKRVSINRSATFEPYLNIANNGCSLGNIRSERKFEHESRWVFRSHTVPDDRGDKQKWGHRILKWEMTENDIEKYPIHNNKVLTAFAYEHSGGPFLMKVEVSGKLRHWRDRLKSNTKKIFRPRAGMQQDISTTLVGAYRGQRRHLDQIAQGLAKAMEDQNYKLAKDLASAMAAQNPIPATQTAPLQHKLGEMPSTHATEGHHSTSGASNHTFRRGAAYSEPDLDLDGQRLNTVEPDVREPAMEDRTAPTLDNLARVGEYFSTPIRRDAVRSDVSEASGDSSASTLVAERSETLQTSASPPKNVDEEVIARVMEFTFLRLLIRKWLALWIFLGLGKPLENSKA